MDEDLISKKELLERYGISYGALYRWKRMGLIPEAWFLRRSAPTGQETYFRREEARAALAGLERLPEPYGEVLRLRALGGLSFRDIGAAYGKTETWARVTCFRARQRLKEEME